MAGNLTFDQLKKAVADGEIDTVLAAAVDMQGRLIGKRFLAKFFVESAYDETHGCNYLLANDIDMEPVPGYKAASWSKGYGDFVMKPDLATIRTVPWLEKTALVLNDIQDHHTHEDLPHSPRAILRKQVARLKERGWIGYFASELEFYLLEESYDSAREKHWQDLKSASPYIGDYLIGITSKEEGYMRRLRNDMQAAGIPIENSKGEWGPGQEEINVRYAEALDMADRHVFLKNGAKEIAHQMGKAVTFMAKYNYGLAGNSSHIHNSLWSADGKTPLFFDKSAPWTLSDARPAMVGRPVEVCQGIHLLPGALHQLLQALPVGHFCADQDHVVGRQPHRGLPAVRRGHQGHPHGMPHRRRRPQPLSRLRGADRGRPRRHRREARTAEAVRRRRLPGGEAAGDSEDAARRDRNAGEVEDAEGRARRGCRRALRPHGALGAARIRPAHHRLGAAPRLRAVLK
jgi:hypothetical protein